MQSVRQRDTAPERALRSSLHRLGLRFRIQGAPLKGLRRSADVIFRREKVAIYLDGCFWHGCPIHGTMAKLNADFWQRKVDANRRRDHDTNERLRTAGWTVVRIWEHEDPAAAAQRIYSIVLGLRSTSSRGTKEWTNIPGVPNTAQARGRT
jgi:DNA mismatch endonuclease (patch repair protein)